MSTGTYKALQQDKSKSDSLYNQAMQTLKSSQADNDRLSREKVALRDSANDMNLQLNAAKENNKILHKQLDDLSAISSSQAESIRKTLDNIGAKDLYLQRLRTALVRRDSVNLAVLLELKAALGSIGDSVVGIKVGDGVVRIDVANSTLFGDSAGVEVTAKGKAVLVRLARVLRDQPDIGCRVDVYSDSLGADSWEMETKRAASVVRTLQNQYNIVQARMTAAAKGEPGRGTRILLVPPAGELSEVLEKR